MPDTTIIIDRDQRDGIYELVRNHLGSIGDFFVALERTKDFTEAERLGLEFAEDFRRIRTEGSYPQLVVEFAEALTSGRWGHDRPLRQVINSGCTEIGFPLSPRRDAP